MQATFPAEINSRAEKLAGIEKKEQESSEVAKHARKLDELFSELGKSVKLSQVIGESFKNASGLIDQIKVAVFNVG